MFKQFAMSAIAVAISLVSSLAIAQDQREPNLRGWNKVSTAECSDIEFTPTVKGRFPEIASACRGVVRSSAGTFYARIAARVDYVRRDLRTRDVRKVTLALLDANDAVLRKVSTTPPRDFRVTMRGQEYTANALARGTELSVYLPADRWELAWSPSVATPLDTRVRIEDMHTMMVAASLEADDAFAFDSAELSDMGRASFDALLDVTKGYVTAVTIHGYTDAIGDENYNLGLSQRRADAAKAYLVEKGVPARRIEADGRGESNPIVDCPNLGGAALRDCLAPNRRAEIALLIPAAADLATLAVTKTYQNPLGEEVVVEEELSVARLSDMSVAKDQLLSACETEIERYCDRVQAGHGLVIGCLSASENSSEPYSQQCAASLDRVTDAVMNRRARLAAVGQTCSAEIAACDAVKGVDETLSCIVQNRMSEDCASTVSQLTSAAF